MALNPNYEAIGKAFTTQYYQVLLVVLARPTQPCTIMYY